MSNTASKGKDKRSVFLTDDQGHKTLDLIELSDIFRRADSRIFERESMAALFNKKAEKLARGLAVFEHGGGTADKEIKKALHNLVTLARDHSVDRIILPVPKDSKAGEHLYKDIMSGENYSKFYNVAIDFQEEPYKASDEVEKLGKPKDPPTNTAFDYGLII